MEKMRLVIVDDTPIVRERLRDTVHAMGRYAIVGEAGSPAEALEVYKRERPDVMILDMKLQSGTGLDVLQGVRKHDQHVRIIVWTNFPYERYRAISKALGADYFFWKATEYDQLLETLRTMPDNALPASLPEGSGPHEL